MNNRKLESFIGILQKALRAFCGLRIFGGLGAIGHQVFFWGAGARPHACENKINTMQNNHNNTKTRKEKTVKPYTPKSHTVSYEILYQATCLSLIFILLSVVTTGCSSTCNRKFGMQEILSRQEERLNKLEIERRVVEIRGKISKDAALRAAEIHLESAIKSLKDSNAVLKASL